MAAYARVNSLTLKVDNVINAEDSFINNRTDYDLWIKTSKDLTKQTANIGDTYTTSTSSFKSDAPFSSWVFNNTDWKWESPVVMPSHVEGKAFVWNEEITNWEEVA